MAALSNLFTRRSINKACSTILGRVGWRTIVLWSTTVGKASMVRWAAADILYTAQIKDTPARIHRHTCKAALGEWEAQWKLWVMSTPLTILNLNHCGIESVQSFLCSHLCICICECGQAQNTVGTVSLKSCMVWFCMHARCRLTAAKKKFSCSLWLMLSCISQYLQVLKNRVSNYSDST